MAERTINKSLAGFQAYDLDVFKNIVLQLYEDGHSVDDAMRFLKSDKSRLRIHPMARICGHCKKGFQLLGPYGEKTDRSKYVCAICGDASLVDGSIYENAMSNLKTRPFGENEKLTHRWTIEEMLNDGIPLECPECKNPKRRLIRITEPQGPGNVEGWTSELYCEKCENDSYSRDLVIDILKKLWGGGLP